MTQSTKKLRGYQQASRFRAKVGQFLSPQQGDWGSIINSLESEFIAAKGQSAHNNITFPVQVDYELPNVG